MTSLPTREILKTRHRLSHQQIDMLLGENEAPKYLQEKINGLKLVHNFLHLITFLSERGVEFISVKGPLLSQLIYGDATVRFSHDFDILVEPEQVEKIHNLFLSNGYSIEHETNLPEDSFRQHLLMDVTHHLAYKHNELGYMVEMHWTLIAEAPVSQKMLKSIVYSNTKFYHINGKEIKSLNEEMLLAYLIIHGTKHAWERLKWLVDIKDFPFEKIDKTKFKALAKTLNIEKALVQTGALIGYYFGIKKELLPPTNAPKETVNYCIKKLTNPIGINISLKYALSNLFYKLRIFAGLNYKLRVLSTTMQSITDIQSTKMNSKLLYMLYRPFSFIKRRFLHA